ncbi:Hypothetical protein RLITU_1879 [Romboutsia lituseburensis]|nr:hypothetical protein [Romboutsia lituseburensis]CEH34467.1 Hypothetical protein RLITU_1879 [Romboutsia lituseburensis]
MIKNFKELMDLVIKNETKTIAVAVAQDKDVLSAVNNAYKMG